MAYTISFNEEKNQLLIATRKVSFEQVIQCINSGKLVDEKEHFNKNRPLQRIYIVNIEDYIYVVPYVLNHSKKEIFLKTIFPSRKLTKQYLSKGEI